MRSRLWFLRQPLALGVAFIVAGVGAVVCAQAPGQTAGPQPAMQLLQPRQLDDLVAPIALYPDPLLSQVLAACTYPLEVVEAQQWLQGNNGLSGTGLMEAARQQNWDPSVQALVAFPNVLAELNQNVRWTTDLGNAFLAQPADVMSAVQRMRASARANGKLSSSPQQVVTTGAEDGQSAIAIQPADPQVIYVPTYDPAYIWGPPAGGYYPALLYPGFGFGFWPGLDVGLCFGGWGGWGGWGWGPNWFGGGIFVNHAFFRNYGFRGGFGTGFQGRGPWTHDPAHRLGVSYPNGQLSQRYQAVSRANAARMGSRFTPRQSSIANRGAFQGSQNGARQYGSRSAMSRPQSFRSAAPQARTRSYQTSPRYQAQQSYRSAPRYSAPAQRFSGGGARSFGGGGAHGFSGGGHSFGGGSHGGGHRR